MVLFNQYRQVLKLQFLRNPGPAVTMGIVQILLSLGISIGFTYLYTDIDSQTLLFLTTGAPTMVILITGLVIMPTQLVVVRAEGHADFLRTLPINRAVIIMADATIWVFTSIPSTVIALIVTNLIYQPNFEITIWSIPAYLLCILTSISVGYGFSYGIPPMAAMALSQVLAFGVLMFSPISFPADRLPTWLQFVHNILPIESMARILRASIAAGTFEMTSYDIIKVSIWCVLGFLVAIRVLNKK